MERLGELTDAVKASAARLTAGRYLQILAQSGHNPVNALDVMQSRSHWGDAHHLVNAIKSAAVTPMTTANFPTALVPIADSFLGAMRPYSIPLQLTGLRKVPMLTRIFIGGGMAASEIVEGAAIPVLQGSWATTTLEPRRFGGIVVQTMELMKSASPTATAAIVDDLARATAEAENFAFLNPDASGSVLNGATNFVSTGATVAAVDTDLKTLVGNVAGAFLPGAAIVATKQSATFLGTLRGSGGGAAFPNIGPQGGILLGLPVLISSAMEFVGSPNVRAIALLSPSEIFWADEGDVRLSTSSAATLKMDSAPSAAAGNLTSMYQTDGVAVKAIRTASWYARAGAAAYFVCGY